MGKYLMALLNPTAKINKSEPTTQNTATLFIQVFDKSMKLGEVFSKKAHI